MKKALVTDINGQDGSFLAELLLAKGYEVFGVWVKGRVGDTQNLPHIADQLHIFDASDTQGLLLAELIKRIQPQEVYHLNAPLRRSHALKIDEVEPHAAATLHMLEAIRLYSPKTKFFQSVSPEVYGHVTSLPIQEETPFYPVSSHGVAELYAVWMVRNFRETYRIFACNGILFSHTSTRCKTQCLTQEIAGALGEIARGRKNVLKLGNLDIVRDWGYAADYAAAMWKMLQEPSAEDFVIATGEGRSVREFVTICGEKLGMDLVWEGQGKKEKGYDALTGKLIVEVCPPFHRRIETDLLGCAKKAKRQLDWEPQTTFDSWVDELLQPYVKVSQDHFQHA
ncbi:MAG: GDP-mannose 4,6-dehydratase [Bacteroidota bacterium]